MQTDLKQVRYLMYLENLNDTPGTLASSRIVQREEGKSRNYRLGEFIALSRKQIIIVKSIDF